MHVGQPSTTIYGLAEVLYGEVSPAGRTIQTVYPASCPRPPGAVKRP